MVRTRLLAAVSLVALLAGCGNSKAPSPTEPPRTWSVARIRAPIPGRPGERNHADRVGGLAEVGDELVLVGQDRLDHWFVLARNELADGSGFVARRIEPTFNDSAWVGGRGPLAARAVSIGAMKDLPTEVVGLGVWPDGRFALLDRRQRILWSGRLLAGPGGRISAITFDRGSVLPGGDHSGLDEADPRDRGPGVRALAVLPEPREGVDIAVLEASAKPDTPWRVHRLDRTGATVKRPLDVPSTTSSPLQTLAWTSQGFVAIESGHLRRLVQDGDRLVPGEAHELPPVKYLSPWSALTQGVTGTTYVGSEFRGAAVVSELDDNRTIRLAWR
ncbi:MAG: hypothetical protein AB7T63_09180 [Planctomycetota bacterium]